jgi:hypothetical protein
LHAQNATEPNEFVYETLVNYRWRPNGLAAGDDFAQNHTIDRRPPYAKIQSQNFADYFDSMAQGCSNITKVAEQHDAALLYVELPLFEAQAHKGVLKHLPTLEARQRRTLMLAGDDHPHLSVIETNKNLEFETSGQSIACIHRDERYSISCRPRITFFPYDLFPKIGF